MSQTTRAPDCTFYTTRQGLGFVERRGVWQPQVANAVIEAGLAAWPGGQAGGHLAVIRVDGNRIVVRRMHAPNAQECVMSASEFVNRAATRDVAAGGFYGRTR